MWVDTRFVASEDVGAMAMRAHKAALLSVDHGNLAHGDLHGTLAQRVRQTSYVEDWEFRRRSRRGGEASGEVGTGGLVLDKPNFICKLSKIKQ